MAKETSRPPSLAEFISKDAPDVKLFHDLKSIEGQQKTRKTGREEKDLVRRKILEAIQRKKDEKP
jgi:hypothetical protein